LQTITIDHTGDAGQRLDRFIKKYLPNAPLGGIYRMLRTGKIKVNKKKKDQTYSIEIGDQIDFWLTDEEIGEFKIQNSESR
jgi:23S rRNA pseudouridine955/2504/2580 synthase